MSLKMVPFKILGMVSYWPSIVTMAISLAISQIISIKEWPEIEIWLKGLSRSLKLVPFKSMNAVSNPPSIVSMALSCIVCEI